MNRAVLRLYFSIGIVMLVMLLVSFPLIEPGSGSMVVAQLTLVMLVSMVGITGGLIYRESRKRPEIPIDYEDEP